MHPQIAAALLAVTLGGPAGFGMGAGAKAATLSCANPRLPAAILAGSNAAVSSSVAADPLPTVVVDGATAPLTLAVVANDPDREKGLMCVTALRRDTGMIFVFPDDRSQEFWMKNTVEPLDMIWVEPDGRVTTVAANVPAATLQTPVAKLARRRGDGQFVIELAAGTAARLGIAPGTHLDLPESLRTSS